MTLKVSSPMTCQIDFLHIPYNQNAMESNILQLDLCLGGENSGRRSEIYIILLQNQPPYSRFYLSTRGLKNSGEGGFYRPHCENTNLDTRFMVGGRIISAASISSTTRALEVAIGVRARSIKILKDQSTVQRTRYNNLGNFTK